VAHEWVWICSTVVWSWIATRSEQAATEGWDQERAIRTTGLSPDPWDAGAIASILPKLFDALPELDWTLPLGSWPKEAITEFLMVALGLCQRAVAARDVTEAKIAGKTDGSGVVRPTNAATGNSRMIVAELNDGCPF
jgi:hypothetical protein